MKLRYKITLLIFAILLVVGLIGGTVFIYLHRQSTIAHFEESALTVATALYQSLRYDMIGGKREHIQNELTSIVSERLINEIRILSRDREVYASGNVSEIGRIRNNKDIAQALATGETVTRVKKKNGQTGLSIIMPVANELECQKCHTSKSKVQGVVITSVFRS